jgi:hypothetical protein
VSLTAETVSVTVSEMSGSRPRDRRDWISDPLAKADRNLPFE